MFRAPAYCCHVKRETGPVQGKGRGGACLSVFRSWFRSPDGAKRNPGTTSPLAPPPRITLRSIRATKKMKEAERRQTQGNHRRILRCGARSTERARLSAFHHGSHLRELFHPKGSASGQASWDAVCTGVTRLRLSQSREAPPAPVIMSGD